MIEQLATNIRTKKTKLHHHFGIQKKPALDVWGGALKIETEGQPSTLKDLNLDAKNFTENWRNKNEWLQNKFKSLMAFFLKWCTGRCIFCLGQATELRWIQPWYYK